MKWLHRHNAPLAGVLLAVFLSVFVVKGFHTHGPDGECGHHCNPLNERTADNSDTHSHTHDHCFICHFIFSPFIAGTEIVFNPNQIILSTQIGHAEISIETASIRLYNLRAPPTIG